MIKTPEIASEETVRVSPSETAMQVYTGPFPGLFALLKQVTRFSLVGGLNTLIDLLCLNGLLWLLPTTSTVQLLLYNACAYSVGAINSFVCNKYWTFKHYEKPSRQELTRFVLVTLLGIALNSVLLWLATLALHALFASNPFLWANVSKVLAIAATVCLSYLGMRLWVFTNKKTHRRFQKKKQRKASGISDNDLSCPHF